MITTIRTLRHDQEAEPKNLWVEGGGEIQLKT
jgi:hypothetical protein